MKISRSSRVRASIDFCAQVVRQRSVQNWSLIAAYSINNKGQIAGGSRIDSGQLHATLWTATCSPINPLFSEVDALVNAGLVNKGQGTSLTAKLNAASKQLDGNNTNAAGNVLEALLDELNAYVNGGKLTQTEAQSLIDATQDIINQLNN